MLSRRLPFLRFSRHSLVPVVDFNFIAYLVVGLPMAVIPLFMVEILHFNTIWAGLAVSLQYFATFASRPQAGKRIDVRGPKTVVIAGLMLCAFSGVLLLLSGIMAHLAFLSLFMLFASRCALGWGESWTTTAAIIWNIRRAGPSRTAQAISWNGVTSYGGIAVGATIGAQFYHFGGHWGGFILIGTVSILLPLIGAFYAQGIPKVIPFPTGKAPMPFWQVFRRVLPLDGLLSCGAVGFGAISSCLALYYAARQWPGASLALAIFGLVFVCVRFIFTQQIARLGGARVAMISLLVEAMGLLVLAFSGTVISAFLGAALTGAGFSLIFPALGVLAVESAGMENRGAALGAYSVFSDLAIGLSGPILGLVIALAGYAALFVLTAAITTLGAVTLLALQKHLNQRMA